jgi:hypothetical protein
MKDFSASDNHFTVDGTGDSVSMLSAVVLASRPGNRLTVWQKKVNCYAKNDGNNSFCKDEPAAVSNFICIKRSIELCLTTSNQRDLR